MSTAEQDLFDLLHRLSTAGLLRQWYPAFVGEFWCRHGLLLLNIQA